MDQTRAFTGDDRQQIVRLLNGLPREDTAGQLRMASALAWIGLRARKRDSAVRGRLSSPARGRVGAAYFLPALKAFPALPMPVRCEVALALGDLAGGAAVTELARLATASCAEARLIAVDALGKIGGPEAVESLTAAAGDVNETVRAEAVRALGQLALAEKDGKAQGLAAVGTLLLDVSALRQAGLRQPRTSVDRTRSPVVSIPA